MAVTRSTALPLCESWTRNRWHARHAGRDPEYPSSPETDTLPSSTISLQMNRLKLGGLALPPASANTSRHLAHELTDPLPTALTISLD